MQTRIAFRRFLGRIEQDYEDFLIFASINPKLKQNNDEKNDSMGARRHPRMRRKCIYIV